MTAVAILFLPSICLGNEQPDGNEFEPIDKQEYLIAQRDTQQYNLTPKRLAKDSAILDEFLSKVIEMDEQAKWVYSRVNDSDPYAEIWYDLFEITFEDTPIYMLEFVTGIWDFCYLATKASNGTLYISDVRIDSAPIVFSKEGYIAGFDEVVDAYYVQPTICTFSLDKTTGNISVKKIGTFSNIGDPWKLDRIEYQGEYMIDRQPAFWYADTLYMEGLMLDTSPGHEHTEIAYPCYYKLDISKLQNVNP